MRCSKSRNAATVISTVAARRGTEELQLKQHEVEKGDEERSASGERISACAPQHIPSRHIHLRFILLHSDNHYSHDKNHGSYKQLREAHKKKYPNYKCIKSKTINYIKKKCGVRDKIGCSGREEKQPYFDEAGMSRCLN